MITQEPQRRDQVRRLAAWSAGALLFVLLLVGALRMFGLERRFIYFPSREVHTVPGALGLLSEDITARTPDGETIRGWWIHREPRAPRPTLLLSHGNAGSIADRLHRVAHLQRSLDVDFVLYDYRGYGQSSGSPDEPGTYADSRAVYDWLAARGVPPGRIVLFGESLGCAVSVQLALDRSAAGLILEAPFASVRAMARLVMPWLPAGPLLRTRYDNQEKIPRVAIPLLLFHGTADEVIPFAQGEAVFRAAREPKRFVPVAGAHHNDVYVVGGPDYVRALAEFLRSLSL
jgi:fermentation-respiration switch protein FrsA (DUF1100 family)